VAGEELAHANEAEIREVGLPIGVSLGERGELGDVLPAVEGQSNEPLLQHREDDRNASQVKPRFCQDRLTGQEGLADLLSHANRPLMMAIVAVNDCRGLPALALSSWSRTILPWGTPVFAATCTSQAASSLGRRTVIVWLICQNCSRSLAPRQALAQDLVGGGRPDLLTTVQRDSYGGPIAPPVPRPAPPGRPATTWTVRQPPRVWSR
jgi:hypothetical protein